MKPHKFAVANKNLRIFLTFDFGCLQGPSQGKSHYSKDSRPISYKKRLLILLWLPFLKNSPLISLKINPRLNFKSFNPRMCFGSKYIFSWILTLEEVEEEFYCNDIFTSQCYLLFLRKVKIPRNLGTGCWHHIISMFSFSSVAWRADTGGSMETCRHKNERILLYINCPIIIDGVINWSKY